MCLILSITRILDHQKAVARTHGAVFTPSMTSPTRVAIVTGAATGLGRAIALRLARDGFAIMANDLPKQIDGLELLVREIKSMDGNAKFFEGDVTVEENVRRLVESAVTEFGGLDVVGCDRVGSKSGLLIYRPTDGSKRGYGARCALCSR